MRTTLVSDALVPPEKVDDSPRAESRALLKGLQVLESLAASQLPASLAEISRRIDLGKASTLRLLQTLVATAYLRQTESGDYLVTGNWVRSEKQDWVDVLVSVARVKMEWLNLELAETVSLAALMGDHIRVVATIESPRHIRMSNYCNRILAPYASSLGKAIAAYQTPEKLQELLQVYGIYATTEKTITDPPSIRREMENTRTRGFSTEHEETVHGGCCIGAPIFVGGAVRSAISVSVPADRMTPELESRLPQLLHNAAAEISDSLPGR